MKDVKFLYHNARSNGVVEQDGINKTKNKLLLFSNCDECLKYASKIDNEVTIKINCENITVYKMNDSHADYYTYDEILPSYIEVINKLRAFEQNNNINFEQFVEMLKKGYLNTCNVNNCDSNLDYTFSVYKPLRKKIEIIDKYNFVLTITRLHEVRSKFVHLFTALDDILYYACVFLGYYPIELYTDHFSNERFFKWNEMNDYNIPEGTCEIKIVFTSKYNDEEGTNDLEYHKIFYHISEVDTNDIMKYGIYPNTKHIPCKHPNKIVLYKNLEDCTNRLSDNQHLYEINLTDYDIIVHYDKKNNIYFTMTTIGYHRIKLIK